MEMQVDGEPGEYRGASSHAGGHRFESCRAHHYFQQLPRTFSESDRWVWLKGWHRSSFSWVIAAARASASPSSSTWNPAPSPSLRQLSSWRPCERGYSAPSFYARGGLAEPAY